MIQDKPEFDAIVVGTGPGGSTVARELAKRGRRVLILESGAEVILRERITTFARILDVVMVGEKLAAMRALTTGGTTAFYGAIGEWPALEAFRALGIDLAEPIEQVRAELDLAHIPDQLLGRQVLKVRDSAVALGLPWAKRPMLVDLKKCPSGYAYEAKWNARSFLQDALEEGAKLVTRAKVKKVLLIGKRAIGVEYELSTGKGQIEVSKAYGDNIVLAAGSLSSPMILRNSGIKNIASRGFYCDPCMTLIANVRGMKGTDSFVGSMGTDFENGISYGDASLSRFLYRMWMLDARKFLRLFAHRKMIGVGFIVKDGLGGELGRDGRYRKDLTEDERAQMEKGKAVTRKILENAGGKNILESIVSSARVGGLVRIREHLNEKLETEFRNLHVCDGSMIPEDIRVSPTLTLICLGKYLANQLAAAG